MAGDMRAILALDLGTTTGWAYRGRDGGIASGSVDLSHDRYAGGGMRYLRMQNWLASLPKVDVVYFEEVRRHLGTSAAHVYGGLLAVVSLWCEAQGVPYQGVPVGTVKRHVAGRGNASKGEVMQAVRRLGYEPESHDEADALAVLHWALAQQSAAVGERDGTV